MVNENERTPKMILFRKASLTYNKMLANDDPTVSYANFKVRLAHHTPNNECEAANIVFNDTDVLEDACHKYISSQVHFK